MKRERNKRMKEQRNKYINKLQNWSKKKKKKRDNLSVNTK